MHSVRESYTHALTNYVLARALDRAIGQELGNTMCGLYCVRCFLSLRQMGNLDRVLAYGIMDVTLASKIADTATQRLGIHIHNTQSIAANQVLITEIDGDMHEKVVRKLQLHTAGADTDVEVARCLNVNTTYSGIFQKVSLEYSIMGI